MTKRLPDNERPKEDLIDKIREGVVGDGEIYDATIPRWHGWQLDTLFSVPNVNEWHRYITLFPVPWCLCPKCDSPLWIVAIERIKVRIEPHRRLRHIFRLCWFRRCKKCQADYVKPLGGWREYWPSVLPRGDR
jgi:hypothetical protein